MITDHGLKSIQPPRLEQQGALGWQQIPLDGLNCYLRSIEAVMRSHGLAREEILFELGGAVSDDMPAGGSPWFQLRSWQSEWVIAGEDEQLWPNIERRLARGEPVLVWPDFFHWPGSRFHRRRHVFDHAILLTRSESDRVTFLDIDADRRNGFVSSMALDEEVRLAFKRVLRLRPAVLQAPPPIDQVVNASIPALMRWVQGLRRLIEWWGVDPHPSLAHAVEWWIFSDVQPQLFLFTSICEAGAYEDLARAGEAATTQARKAGLFLIALNEYKSAAPYRLALDDIVATHDLLRDITYVAIESAGSTVSIGCDPDGEKLWQRLSDLARWHLGTGLGPTVGRP